MPLPAVLDTTNGCGPRLRPSVGLVALAAGTGGASLRGWWKTDDLAAYTDGATVATWPDASGNGHDFTTDAGLTSNPIIDGAVTLNGQRGLKFWQAGVRDSMSADGVAMYPACVNRGSVFWLFKRNGGNGAPAANTQTDAAASHWPFSDGLIYDRSLRKRGSRANNISASAIVSGVCLVEVSSSAADGWTMRANGVTVATAGHTWVEDMSQFRIGGNLANGFYAHAAHYWEVLAYDAVPSSSERSEIHAHFNAKYGLALPT